MDGNFETQLVDKILSSLENSFQDHLNFYLSGNYRPSALKTFLKKRLPTDLRRMVRSPLQALKPKPNLKGLAPRWNEIALTLPDLRRTYDLMSDEYSKQLLIQILAFRVLGEGKVRLPLNQPTLQNDLDFIFALTETKDYVESGFLGWKLTKTDCSKLGAPIQIYSNVPTLHAIFKTRQYECPSNPLISVSKGDTVIDAGGCWGDTALLFAHQCGPTGKVVSAEFVPSNLEIFHKNLNLNKGLAERVKVLENPLWSEADLDTFVVGNGPATKVQFDRPSTTHISVKTVSIDSLCQTHRLERVNFIKMDIEGAELPALQGAVHTLKRDRPKLAISLYHSLRDMAQIPSYLDSLNLGYRFYLGHFTINAGETVLFAST